VVANRHKSLAEVFGPLVWPFNHGILSVSPVAVEKVRTQKFAKMKSRQDAL
jgi:hypothetical protein